MNGWQVRSADRALKTEEISGPNPDLWPKAASRISALEFGASTFAGCGVLVCAGRSADPKLATGSGPSGRSGDAVPALSGGATLVAAVGDCAGCGPVDRSGLLVCRDTARSHRHQHALLGYADGLSRQVRGRVMRVRELAPIATGADHDNEPGWWAEKEEDEEAAAAGALSVDLQVDEIEEVTPDVSQMVPMTGGVRMNVVPDKAPSGSPVLPNLRCGDLVQAPMRLKIPERYRDPGAWQYADYLLAQGVGSDRMRA